MNKIIKEHYPISRLPADLREGLPEGSLARVEIDADPLARHSNTKPGLRKWENNPQSAGLEALKADMEYLGNRGNAPVTWAEANARIRALRDEWDDQ